jgi:molybdopterin-containing oxidoreductase family iron-sulfur binding subunit
MPAETWKSVIEANWSGASWRQTLARGGEFGEAPAREAVLAESVSAIDVAEPALAGNGDYTLVPFPHSYWRDGRGAALPWLQEMPDPVTKLSWNSWAEISRKKADELGVVFGDVVRIESDAGAIEVSVYPRGGIRDDVIAIPVGQGHTVGHYASMAGDGQPGVARGANVAALLPAATDESGGQAYVSTKVKVSKTGRFRRVALSQVTDNQRERGLAPEVSLYALATSGDQDAHGGAAAEHGGEADHGDGGGEHHFEGPPFEYDAAHDADPNQPYRWGMAIDNDKCTGCGACVAACYIENNISIVGEENTIKRREMSWLHIQRYVGDGEPDVRDGEARRPTPDGEVLGENEVRHLPMLCQHCGAAPCEAVCPVIATYHTDEGINGMVYNRCVGTRYCGNNCVYKVRRFNYFDYGRKNWPGLLGLMANPDVTVRGQGVMEKCSFCVQRIEAARQPAKDAGEEIKDGAVVTACQQACPSGAIQFGNYRDESSELVKKVHEGEDRAYHALQILNARPGVTYLAQVRREKNEGVH